MPVEAHCTKCGKRLVAHDKAAGKRARCPACGTVVLFPDADGGRIHNDGGRRGIAAEAEIPPHRHPSSPGANNPAPPAAPRTPGDDAAPAEKFASRLIPCEACGRSIAQASAACPDCGAPNSWAHPEIRRFMRAVGSLRRTPPFEFIVKGFALSGYAHVRRGIARLSDYIPKLFGGGVLASWFGVYKNDPTLLMIGPVAIFVALIIGMFSILFDAKETDTLVRFHIDFSEPTPRWWSNDDDFWAEVKDFFLRPRPVDDPPPEWQ